MNLNTPRRLKSLARSAGSLLSLALALGADGASLTWDSNTGTTGAQDGSGTWTTAAGGWWNGSANVNWAASDIATFGGGTDGTYALTVGGAITCGTPLTFNNSGYTLSAAATRVITFGGTVTVAAGKIATIGNNVELTRSAGAFTLNGPGTLNISGPGGKFGSSAGSASAIATGARVNVQNSGALFSGSSLTLSGVSGGSILNVDGGSVSVAAALNGNLVVNTSGSGSAIVSLANGGSISTDSTTTGGVRFGGTGGWGVFNLDGGTLTTGRIYENAVAVLSTNNFNGGILRALSGTSQGATFMIGLDRANVRNGGAVFDPNGQSITIGQALLHSDISGDNAIDGGVTVVGTGGTLILTGANTYTGPTAIGSNYVLSITPPYSTLGSGVIVSNGARLSVTANTSSSVLPPLTLNDGGGVKFDLGSYNPANVPGITNANLVVSGTNVIDITGSSIPVTNITLLAYTSKTGTSTFVLGRVPSGMIATLTDTGSALILNVTAVGTSYVWSAGSGNWDFVTANWNSGTSIYSELQLAMVTFPASAAGMVNISANVNPYLIAVDATGTSYTFSGAGSISGATSFSKSGAKLITLSTSNSYPGVTAISAGSIVATTNNALGSTAGATTIAAGTALALSGGVNYAATEPLTITGPGVTGNHFFVGSATQRGALQGISGDNTWAGNITFNPTDSNVRIGVQDGAKLTITGSISQSVNGLNLIFRTGNTAGSDITISGTNNNWTGESEIFGGGGAALHLGTNNALPKASLLRVGTAGIGGDCVFDLNGFNQEVAGITGDAVGLVRNNGAQTSTLTLNPSASQTYPGAIQNGTSSLSLLKSGANIQSLAGTSTYSGPTTINGGTLRITGSLGSTSVSGNDGGRLDGNGTIGGPVAINAGGTLATGAGGISTLTINNTLTLAGTNLIRLNKAGVTRTSDLVTGITTLNCGGTVTITATGDSLAVGDEFTVFSAGAYSGNFTSITPAPGSGLAWDTTKLATQGKLLVHANPTANSDTAGAQHGQTITIPTVKMLANDTGESGETLSLTAVSANASLGGSLVTYTAPTSGSSDTIAYTLSDGRGGTATGTINITLNSSGASFNQLSAAINGFGDLVLSYLGIPGTNYALEVSHSLTPPVNWSPLRTNAAANNGSLLFTNTPSLAPTNDFYRTRYVP